MRIRKAKLEDLERIADFNIQMAEETEDRVLDRNIVREGVKEVLKNESKGFYLIAEDNKKGKTLTGQLMVTYEWSDWRNKVFWWIQSVYVDKKYRKQKVFSGLFDAISSIALSQKNVTGLRLYVEKNNNSAKQVYKKLGMNETPYEIFEKTL
jgi:GNAT superfamily N-acetyltransferase